MYFNLTYTCLIKIKHIFVFLAEPYLIKITHMYVNIPYRIQISQSVTVSNSASQSTSKTVSYWASNSTNQSLTQSVT